MPYIEEVCVAGGTIEISKYYAYRAHAKGETRAEKEKPTSEAQKKVNQRKAEKDLRRLMAANFKNGDAVVRLDFVKKPEDSQKMQKLISEAIIKIRREYARAKETLKYIYVKEVGKRKGRHIHMIMSKEDIDVLKVLRKCWPHGGIHVDPWWTGPNFSKLANYFIKYATKTEETEGKLIGKRWYASRNLEKPVVKKRVIESNRFKENIKKKKGFVLDKETVVSGISEYTGFQYFSYTLIKTRAGQNENQDIYRVNMERTCKAGRSGNVDC